MMSSSTRSGGIRAAICNAISPFSARLSLWSDFKPSTRISRLALASSTSNTRQSDRFFMTLVSSRRLFEQEATEETERGGERSLCYVCVLLLNARLHVAALPDDQKSVDWPWRRPPATRG